MNVVDHPDHLALDEAQAILENRVCPFPSEWRIDGT
jgi:hypothetical protein